MKNSPLNTAMSADADMSIIMNTMTPADADMSIIMNMMIPADALDGMLNPKEKEEDPDGAASG